MNAKPAPREAFGPSLWFAVSGGRDAGAEPRRLLPMLCKAGDISKDDIGAIRVQKDKSYVQILEKSVPGFLAAVGDAMTLEEGATLTQLAEAPVLERPERPRGGPGGHGGPGGKPKFGGKPRGDKPAYGKPRGDKPAYDKPRGDKPAYDKPRGDKPAKPKYTKSTPPVDWDDAPAPRYKKPKPPSKGGKPAAAKPHRKGTKPPAQGGHQAPRRTDPEVHGSKPSSAGKPKGPPPPKGKANSKKNKARAAAKAAQKPAKARHKQGKGN